MIPPFPPFSGLLFLRFNSFITQYFIFFHLPLYPGSKHTVVERWIQLRKWSFLRALYTPWHGIAFFFSPWVFPFYVLFSLFILFFLLFICLQLCVNLHHVSGG